MAAETVARTSQDTAGTETVTTIDHIDGQPIVRMAHLAVRLEVTTAIDGTVPTLDIYLQRATQPSPGADDWDDFYHFPQQTDAGANDLVVHLPLPNPQDVDGSLGSASHAVVQESLAADTLLSGHWGEQIRIREVVTGTDLTAAVYNLHFVGA